MNRKEFIKTCGLGCIAGTSLVALLQSCTSTNYFAQHTLINNRITIKRSEFVKTEKGRSAARKYILIKPDTYNFPICIFKLSEGNYSAVLMECTHRGCELQANGEYLFCPCHGSEFNNKGVVQNPPAEENLKLFKTTTDNENIYIQL